MSINRVILTGRLGKDPEVKSTPSGKNVANFSLAVDDGFGDKKQTYWFRCVAWEKQADVVGSYCTKGSQIAVDGRLVERSWEQNGEKKYVTEIVCQSVQLLDSKAKAASNSQADGFAVIDDSDIPF